MTRKRRRMLYVAIGLVLLGSATALVLSAFQNHLILECQRLSFGLALFGNKLAQSMSPLMAAAADR